MVEFKNRLKELRQTKKWKQKDVAALLEISTTCYAGYEQGYREPDLTTLKKICFIFNETSDYLLGIEDEAGRNTIKYLFKDNNFGNNNTFN